MTKSSSVTHCISFELLRFIRDSEPTVSELLFWLGDAHQSRFHLLRKSGVLVIDGDVVRLSPQHLSQDGKRFHWGHYLYHLDEERLDVS